MALSGVEGFKNSLQKIWLGKTKDCECDELHGHMDKGDHEWPTAMDKFNC